MYVFCVFSVLNIHNVTIKLASISRLLSILVDDWLWRYREFIRIVSDNVTS